MSKIVNREIKIAMLGLKQYDVADKIGVTEFTFSRWLRKELSPDRRAQVMAAIEKINKEAAQNVG